MELFDGQETRTYIARCAQQLKAEVEGMSDEDITTCDIQEWTDYLVDKYTIATITLFDDELTHQVDRAKIRRHNAFAGYDPYEPRYFEVDGYKITFHMPYDGDANLFHLRPSSRILKRFEAANLSAPRGEECGVVSLSFEYTAKDLESHSENMLEYVRKQFENDFQGYRTMLSNVETDVKAFNAQLPETVRRSLEERRRKAETFAAIHKALEIPLKRSATAPNATPIPLKRIVRKPKQQPRHKPLPEERAISDFDYENINNIIFSTGTTMEKTARTYYRNNEEELRDHLLASLNTHYDNATGETFRKLGKADIHIEFENKAAFIGECKIWHGEKAFDAAVQQALNYTTWRDVKIAVIIFNKENKDFEGVIEKLNDWVGSHTTFHKREAPNRWKCDLYCEDRKAVVKLTVLAFDLFVDQTQFQDSRSN